MKTINEVCKEIGIPENGNHIPAEYQDIIANMIGFAYNKGKMDEIETVRKLLKEVKL